MKHSELDATDDRVDEIQDDDWLDIESDDRTYKALHRKTRYKTAESNNNHWKIETDRKRKKARIEKGRFSSKIG